MSSRIAQRVFLRVFPCLLLLLEVSHAADDTEPVPPYVSPVPANADWVMKVKSTPTTPNASSTPTSPDSSPAQGSADSVAVVSSLHFTKVGDLQRVILGLSDSKSQEFYKFKSYHFVPTTVPGRILVTPFVPTAPPYPFYSEGFFGVDWIQPDFYKGVAVSGTAKCFHYKGTKPNPLANIPNLPPEAQAQAKRPIPCEAWIECKTQLPIRILIDQTHFEFVYATAPDHLDLPPAYQAALKWQENQISRLEALRVR